ncbi:hypothetical protein KY290_013850 [Solanum tuberosum]|uniref:Uncharacterized protein n=1 Tax=Solanum tuberosum TaxID=4113 RepID=A0ABQ7VMX4_SOLTU|nr:hypothetical protein KY289_013960 [Solanum tuberosum]KAH0769869.1 hypothetical protein KY290_013850 [Solanum tuberosum]
MQQLGIPKPLHTFREQNKVGDILAKMGRTIQSSSGRMQILEAPPHYAFKAWEADKNELYFDRMVDVTSPNETTGNPPISNYVMNNEVCGFHL